jgi:hypothetical protein
MGAQTVFDAFMSTARDAPGNAFLCAPPAPSRAYHPDGVQVREEVLYRREAYARAGYGHGHRVALRWRTGPSFSSTTSR